MGPLEKADYSFELAKEDFTFAQIESTDPGTFTFKAQRVARLEVQAVDELDGVPLADVFVTFSAGKTILRGQTDQEGRLKFSDVTPQKYYLTAIKKEYSFGSLD